MPRFDPTPCAPPPAPRPRHALIALAAALCASACGGGHPTSSAQHDAPRDLRAPAWARATGERDGAATRFTCEGRGPSEASALVAASVDCDDQLCRACGVSIEAVLESEETLEGQSVRRRVVERCRMTRAQSPPVERSAVACEGGTCVAWLAVSVSDKLRAETCPPSTDGAFADPSACQSTLEAFARTPGYSAESFRRRVALMDRAQVECASIDVRPTPLMTALDAKLKSGMRAFNRPASPTPSWLDAYWLAPDPALWQSHEEDPGFVSRLARLRGYLAHKVLVMDVVEASEVPDLDTPLALARLTSVSEALPPDPAYGTVRGSLIAARALDARDHAGRMSPGVDLRAIQAVLMAQYDPATLAYPEDATLAAVFTVGGVIDEGEWAWLRRVPARSMAHRMALEVLDHEVEGRREARFDEALARALDGVPATSRQDRLEHLLPGDLEFFLRVEPRLPEDLRAGVDLDFLLEQGSRGASRLSPAARPAWASRVERAMRALPTEPEARARRCLSLDDTLRKLADLGGRATGHGETLCACLEGPLASESLSLVNKSALYHRALVEELACVAPLR